MRFKSSLRVCCNRRVQSLILVLAVTLGPALPAGAQLRLPRGDILITNEDGANWLTRIDPVTGDRSKTHVFLGPFFDAGSVAVDLDRDRIYIFNGTVYAQQISTGAHSIASKWGENPVGTGYTMSNVVRGLIALADGSMIAASSSRVVEIEAGTGNRAVFAIMPTTVKGLALLSDGDYISTDFTDTLWRIDGTTGAFAAASSDTLGSGPTLSAGRCPVEVTPGTVALIAGGGIMEIDLATGDRVLVSGPGVGSGPDFVLAWCQTLRSDGTLAVTDRTLEAVFVVDRSSGDRTIVSSEALGIGSGLGLWQPEAITADTDGTVLVRSQGIVRVDLTTGDRTLVRSQEIGGDPAADLNPFALTVAPDGSLLSGSYRAGGAAIVQVDKVTGEGVILSSSPNVLPTGTGPPIRGGEINLEDGGHLTQGGGKGVLHVDMPSGDRTVISSNTVGTGPTYVWINASARGKGSILYVTNRPDQVLAVDLDTGNRVEVSGPTRGTGPELLDIDKLAIEPSGMLVALVGPIFAQVLMRIDPSSGDRYVISSDTVGGGFPFDWTTGVDVEANGMILVSDLSHGVIRVDPTTGERTLMSGFSVETGVVGGGSGSIESPWSVTVVPGGPAGVPALSRGALGLLALGLLAGALTIRASAGGRRES